MGVPVAASANRVRCSTPRRPTLRKLYPDREDLPQFSDDARLIVSEPSATSPASGTDAPESTCGVVGPGREEMRPFRPTAPADISASGVAALRADFDLTDRPGRILTSTTTSPPHFSDADAGLSSSLPRLVVAGQLGPHHPPRSTRSRSAPMTVRRTSPGRSSTNHISGLLTPIASLELTAQPHPARHRETPRLTRKPIPNQPGSTTTTAVRHRRDLKR